MKPQLVHPELHVVGHGTQLWALEQLVSSLGIEHDVFFHGAITRDNVPLWYSAADVCVMPSTSEPLGRVMLEALACGTVFIGAETGGIPDHIQHGINGYLFSATDASELAMLLQQVLQDKQSTSKIKEASLNYVRTKLDWPIIVRRLRQLVEARILVQLAE